MEPTITLLIVIITIVITFTAWNNPVMASKWIMNPYQVHHQKEYWRLLSSGFIHATDMPRGYFHLGFNMYVLYMFGTKIETAFIEIFGSQKGIILYLLLYLLGITLSSIPSLLKHKDNPAYNALGASGGVSSIMFSFIMFAPTSPLGLLFIPIGMPSFLLGTAYLIYSYVMARKGTDRIGHDAHFIGAVFGILFTILIFPEVIDYFIYNIKIWDFQLFYF